jgi:anthranilate synthase component I
MKTSSFEDFCANYKTYPLVPVFSELLGDLDTPVSTFLKITQGPYRFLLESVEGGENRGRFSILGQSALFVFSAKNGQSKLWDVQSDKTSYSTKDPLILLKEIITQYEHPLTAELPFSNGGLFGYLSYDTIRYIENIPDNTDDDTHLDDIHLFIPRTIIVFDNLLHKISLITFVKPNGDVKKDYENAVKHLSELVDKMESERHKHYSPKKYRDHLTFTSNFTQNQFEAIVKKSKKHIQKGDVFQVVLSQRLQVETKALPFDIYRALRVINPSPYMFYVEMENLKVLGSSPETMIKLTDGQVFVKPIAGTRKRGQNKTEDELLAKDLLADPKEQAEHTMLVDLGRNDVGRIAKYGSVKVEELKSIEKYSHVMHIVSTVTGELDDGMDSVDVFKAGFPAGTVSGAPKVRAMEIIDDLEPTKRGIYAGAIGYFGFDGNMDVCIAIRTIYMKGATAYLQAGAGIVADSNPANEYEETLNKARGLLKAIEYAEGGLA